MESYLQHDAHKSPEVLREEIKKLKEEIARKEFALAILYGFVADKYLDKYLPKDVNVTT